MLILCEWYTYMCVCVLVCVGALVRMGKKLRLPVEVLCLPWLLSSLSLEVGSLTETQSSLIH